MMSAELYQHFDFADDEVKESENTRLLGEQNTLQSDRKLYGKKMNAGKGDQKGSFQCSDVNGAKTELAKRTYFVS